MRILLGAIALVLAVPAHAQISNPATVDLSNMATKSDVAAVVSAMPLPSNAPPPAEAVDPSIGSSTRYRRMDDVQPRITRAVNCTLVAGGTCTATYTALPATDPNIIPLPLNSSTQPIICNLVGTATATSATIRCWQLQTTTISLAIVTAGLNLAPSTPAPAGTVVQVTALPKN